MFENPSPMHQKNFAAMRNYCPQPFSGRLSIYQSAEFRYFHGTIPWRWAKLAQQGIHITRVKGEHTMMLNAPAVQGVADVLATQLASRLNP